MITKRLYIGGLTHKISEKDLKDRFGKFGEVSDVELITRNDDHGNPVKTFGYINITISDADFNKCMTVLNKSKWKGGTLQIEAAKESFLHKLAIERQQAAEKTHTKSVSHKEKIIDGLKQAGVENFHMKAAVPGTEIPGHKDWVVSKFGRVLPVLNLKCESKKKVIKCDPSKHCHNIKKLDTGTDATEFTPVSKLTWEIAGGDDEISKKRRGEFPPQKPKPKKIKKTVVPLSSKPTLDSDHTSLIENGTLTLKGAHLAAKEREDNIEVVGDDFLMRSILFQSGESKHSTSSGHVRDDEEYDSADTDEILTRSKGPSAPEKKRNNEDAEIKLVAEKPSAKGKSSEKQPSAPSKTAPVTKTPTAPPDENVDESDSDSGSEESDHSMHSDNSSAESDYEAMMGNCRRLEISFADLEMLAKQCSEDEETEKKPKASTSASAKAPTKRGITPDDILASLLETASSEDESEGRKTVKKKKAKKKNASSTTLPAFMGTKDLFGMSDASTSESVITKSAPQPSEIEIEHLDSSVNDKKDVAPPCGDSESDDDEEEEDSEEETEEESVKEKVAPVLSVNSKKATSKGTLPSSKDSESDDDDEEEEEEEEEDDDDDDEEQEEEVVKEKKRVALDSAVNKDDMSKALSTSKDSESDDDEEEDDDDDDEEEEEMEEEVKETKKVTVNDKKVTSKDALSTSKDSETDSSGEDEEDEEEEMEVDSPLKALKTTQSKTPKETTCPSSASSDSSSEEEDDDEDEDDDDDEQSKPSASKPEAVSSQEESGASRTAPPPPPAPPARAPQVDAEKQKLDNQKRLAALEQRLKESAQQKQLIQGALAKVDAPNTDKSKHIVFGSDEDSEEEDDEDDLSIPNTKAKDLFEDETEDIVAKPKSKESASSKPKTAGASKLFDSSGEEEEDSSDEERFQIKPQFEGKAGQKLMELQTRFGADERFQMDSRFMESEDEDEEEEGLKDSGKDTHADEELSEEKNKNMEILRSVLNIDKQPSASESAKTKIFRDISTLHYDPTREDHAAFEKKKEPKTEGKAAKRKKRAEAEKLPEVSKEIFYDVAVDLKQVFGSSATTAEGEKDVAWDEKDEAEPDAEEEEQEEEMEQSTTADDDTSKHTNISLAVPENTESAGFKFSFFGEDEDMEIDAGVKKDEYKIEALKGPKVSWQADPRFQDSSSEEEEEEDTEETGEEKSATLSAQVTDLKPLKRMFFFYKDDERLKEGPQMFCRPGKLEDLREEWEGQRASLIEEYRKKHKAARKKLKESYK